MKCLAMKKTYIPINKTTTYKGFTLVARQQAGNLPSCAGCFFTEPRLNNHGMKRMDCHKHNLACTPYTRKDKCNVIFVEQ